MYTPQEPLTVERRGVDALLDDVATLVGSAPFRFRPIWKSYRKCRRKWDKYGYKIVVMALVKSGKSTLINSWLGDELLPVSNVPETSQIVLIEQFGGKSAVLERQGSVRARGTVKINNYLRKMNARKRISEADIQGGEVLLRVPSFSLVNHPLSKLHMQILDTPGPNEAGMGQLWHEVKHLLKTVDAVVYLLDFTKLKTIEEQKILQELATLRPDLIQNGHVIFAVNKIDRANRNSQSYEEIIHYVSTLLHQQIPALTITPEQIQLISAGDALDARLILHGRASEKARQDFAEKAFGILGEDGATEEDYQEKAAQLLKDSRIEHLEEAIFQSVLAHKEQLLWPEMLNELHDLLDEFSIELCALHDRLAFKQIEAKSHIEALEQRLNIMVSRNGHLLVQEIEQAQRGFDYRHARSTKIKQRLAQVKTLLAEIDAYPIELSQQAQ